MTHSKGGAGRERMERESKKKGKKGGGAKKREG